MGMLENDFKRCSMRYFALRLVGMRNKQDRQYKNEWERTRWQTAVLLSPHSKRPIDPLKLITFDWERDALTISDKIEKYKSIFEKLTPIASA
jgi:hypothetical protein